MHSNQGPQATQSCLPGGRLNQANEPVQLTVLRLACIVNRSLRRIWVSVVYVLLPYVS